MLFSYLGYYTSSYLEDQIPTRNFQATQSSVLDLGGKG